MFRILAVSFARALGFAQPSAQASEERGRLNRQEDARLAARLAISRRDGPRDWVRERCIASPIITREGSGAAIGDGPSQPSIDASSVRCRAV